MTLPRLEAMTEYWAEHPPTHVLVAAFMQAKSGSKPKKPGAPQLDTDKLKEEIAALGGNVNLKD